MEALPLDRLLEEVRPDRVKMDVEGAEYDCLLTCALPPCVRALVMEVHLRRPEWSAGSPPS